MLSPGVAFFTVRVYTRTMKKHVCHCIALRKASRKVTAIYDAALEPFGISVNQFSELRRIRAMQPVSLSDLAIALDLDRSTVGRNTRVLERMGYVETVETDDRRESAFSLTPAALSVLVEATPAWDAVQARFEQRFDPVVLDQLLESLETL